MKRNSSSNPYLFWNDLALKTGEAMLILPQVDAKRTCDGACHDAK